ncbi:Gfo/Idh/MocA family oxidoreductase [Deminuibacter soli]|uniref:Oxidoreductase n=1 Tax=Deminuibacter soli TaxID=2291815 RepID=A0A3E1NCV4_9BACT|nr:Gfo/Idh/MocA family oxidoreductase [Deminuibacter soli]RFM25839.1 oxidoreductase [Deminuibacter soli]
METVIKVGLIGYGVAAKVMHAPFLATLPQFKVTTVLERSREESKQLFPDAKIVRDIDAMLQEDIDMVVITTPNDTHVPYTAAALGAGKHVVVEKPFTITSDDALGLIATARNSGKVLSVYQNRRYVSDYLTIREITDQQLLGEIHTYEAHYDRYRPEAKPNAWREENIPGSGVFFDLSPHIVDQALCLFGLPKALYADIRCQRPHARVDDFFELHLDYGFNKVILKGGMLVREPGPRYMIHGREGSFIKYGEDPQEALLKQGAMPVGDNWGQEPEEHFGLLHTAVNGEVIKKKYPSKKGHYGNYYVDLYNTIVNGAPLQVKPEQSYNNIRIIELAFESNRLKQPVPCTGLFDM